MDIPTPTKLDSQHPSDVSFTRQQLEWLERQFPETWNVVDLAQANYQRGMRRVVHAVRDKVRR